MANDSQCSNKDSLLGYAVTVLRLSVNRVNKHLQLNSNETFDNLSLLTLKEVVQHDSYDDCWVIIYDRVYNVTNFLKLHPGGDELLMEYAGRDASIAFRGAGHSMDAFKMLKTYEIGELVYEERIFRCESKLGYVMRENSL